MALRVYTANNVVNKYASNVSYPDWRISPHADRRHGTICHTWLTAVEHIIDFSFFGLGG